MLLLDSTGAPLHRTIGFITRYEPVRRALTLIGALYVVGVEVPLIEEDEEEEDRAAPRKRMRRAA